MIGRQYGICGGMSANLQHYLLVIAVVHILVQDMFLGAPAEGESFLFLDGDANGGGPRHRLAHGCATYEGPRCARQHCYHDLLLHRSSLNPADSLA